MRFTKMHGLGNDYVYVSTFDQPAPADPKALAEYQALRERTPETVDGQWRLGLWCERQGLNAEATAHFADVTRLDPVEYARVGRVVAVGVGEAQPLGLGQAGHPQGRQPDGGEQAGLPPEDEAQQRDPAAEPEPGPVEQPSVEGVGRQVAGVALDGHAVAGGAPVQGGVGELDPPEAQHQRRVGVVDGVGRRVVATVHGGPLAGLHAGRDPEEGPQDGGRRRVDRDGAVREAAVEIDGGGEDGDLRHDDADDDASDDVHNCNVAGASGQSGNRACPLAERQKAVWVRK